jgi:hypothetical protein
MLLKPFARRRCETSNGLRKRSARLVRGIVFDFVPLRASLGAHCPRCCKSEHRLGPLALAAGLGTSFTAIGLFVATIGYSIGLDGEFFRMTGAVLLVAAGFALTLPRLQIQLALAGAPLGNWTQQKFGSPATAGLRGQFGVGLLLGAVWSPCVGQPWAPPPFSPPRAGCADYAVLWSGKCRSPDSVRIDISRSDDARAASPSLDRHQWQDSSGRHPDCQRLAHPV